MNFISISMCLVPFPGQCIYHNSTSVLSSLPKCPVSFPDHQSMLGEQESLSKTTHAPYKPNQLKHNMLPGENLCVSPHAVGAITTTRPGCDSKLPQSYLQSGEITCTLHHLNRTAGYLNPPPMGTRCYQVCILFLVTQLVKME